MHKGSESFEERLEKNPIEQQDRFVLDVLQGIGSRIEGSFDSRVIIDFMSNGGHFAEISMTRDQDDSGAYRLHANTGSPFTMLELFEQLRTEGIRISHMTAQTASEEEKRILREAIEGGG